MKTSQEGVNLIKMFEGLHDGDLKKIGWQPKKCPAGIWTEGYGHAMRDFKGNFLKGNTMPIHTMSVEQAEMLLKDDLSAFEAIVSRKIKVPINENQFSALVSHAYNTGGSSTLFNLINAKAPDKDIKNWIENRYIMGGGVILNGLIARRKAESNLYFKS